MKLCERPFVFHRTIRGDIESEDSVSNRVIDNERLAVVRKREAVGPRDGVIENSRLPRARR